MVLRRNAPGDKCGLSFHGLGEYIKGMDMFQKLSGFMWVQGALRRFVVVYDAVIM